MGCWFLVTLLSFPGSRTQVWLFEEEGVGLEGGRFLCGVKQIVPPEQVFWFFFFLGSQFTCSIYLFPAFRRNEKRKLLQSIISHKPKPQQSKRQHFPSFSSCFLYLLVKGAALQHYPQKGNTSVFYEGAWVPVSRSAWGWWLWLQGHSLVPACVSGIHGNGKAGVCRSKEEMELNTARKWCSQSTEQLVLPLEAAKSVVESHGSPKKWLLGLIKGQIIRDLPRGQHWFCANSTLMLLSSGSSICP